MKMAKEPFGLRWERDEKFELAERLERDYDDTLWEEAVRRYEEALNTQPDNPEYLFKLGYLRQLKGKRLLRQATAYYEAGLGSELLQGTHSWIEGKLHAQLISVRAQLDENRKSIAFYKQRLSERPDHPDAYAQLTHCYLKVDQVREAHAVVQAGLRLFPQIGTLRYYEGEALARLGRLEEALEAWERSAQLDGQLIDGRFSRAFAFEREKRLPEAIAEWTRIAEFMARYGFEEAVPQREIARLEQLLRG
ncbi:tetratricopeptide repeat protein [Paenibacillus ginsengarvi]|uniref:Tetratricopeptide repeat protein n=2 Tax=Paenibacillus ginsengarvi TaxID=400777 RepID=A0A3B0B605_9BACL|nr:tetratricopeptide repeat protein [Paenibacillus ginsengarvi]